MTLRLGKIEGKRSGLQRLRWLHSITNSMDEFEQTPGDSEGQGSLVCCSSWSPKESDTTLWLNNKSAWQQLLLPVENEDSSFQIFQIFQIFKRSWKSRLESYSFVWNLIWEGRVPCPVACRILVPWLGPPVLGAKSPNHWTAKEVPGIWLSYGFYCFKVNTARGVFMCRTNKTHAVVKSAQVFHLVTAEL